MEQIVTLQIFYLKKCWFVFADCLFQPIEGLGIILKGCVEKCDIYRRQVSVLAHLQIFIKPGLIRDSETARLSCRIEPGRKYFINVGSVGQPRDGDWRSAYAVYDHDNQQIYIRRVPYDLATAQKKIRAAGLPDALAERLALGK